MTQKIIGLFTIIALLVGIPVALYAIKLNTDDRTRAQEDPQFNDPLADAPACVTPEQTTNVLVEYPYCEGSTCSFNQATCSWDQTTDASQYKVVITEVGSSRVVRDDTIEGSTTTVIFPVTANQEYKCEVSAVNSCGTAGPSSSHQLLCATDTIPTATPTVGPTVPPVLTPIPTTPVIIPTTPPVVVIQPTLPPTGSTGETVMWGAASIGVILVGSIFFLF